ncbi:MAG: C69 family dipeptidase [Chloroflexi bacterium]|nr:C69 family dipeptidase [Chloroflexota bacterium]
MCDTIIATKSATADGVAIFGKNSDRPVNEGQHIAYFPAAHHAAGSRVKCTYIEIPQVEKTHAVLLSKPFWMWGAEMGVNEHGLVIGNEAVFSKVPANKESALLGMDLLRAALERAVTPHEALQVIIDLLEQFGQGGNCASHGESMYYHNSFLIANADDAWVLETVDKQWAARQVEDVYSISNCLTLGDQWDMASPDLVELAVQKGFSKSPGQFHYARDYSDFIYTNFGKGRARCATTTSLLGSQKGGIDVRVMMGVLRHHKDENFDPQAAGIFDVDVCMHAGFGPIRASQSTASMVVHLDGDLPTVFVTGTSAPCTGIFKPIWVDASLSALGPDPASTYDPASLFWSHERLHRATLLNYPERLKTYSAERDELETRFTRDALNLAKASARERADFSARCFREAAQAEAEWLKRVEQIPARRRFLNASAWAGFNRKAGMPGVR